MAALLLPLALAGLAFLCSKWPSPQGIRESLVRATLLLGVLIVVATESLSAFDALTATLVLLVWLGVAVGVGGIAIGLWLRRARAGDERRGRFAFPLSLTIACSVPLALTLITAVVAAPTYPDAMTYHMTRVAHWIQAGNVDYFLTPNSRQNYQKPLAEFAILHLQLLSGSDRWANMVQWAAYAVCGVTVSLILAEARQSPRVQWIGALIVYATPVAILEASGAQNDLVVGLWLLAFLLYLHRGLSDHSPESVVFCGLALGLALATKGTAYLYAPAMAGAVVLARLVRDQRWRQLPPLGHVVIAMAIAACLNLGPWLRSLSVYGTPLCCTETYFVARLTPGDAVSNILRNVALHLGIPKLTGAVHRGVELLSPVDLSDPATTFGLNSFQIFVSLHEGTAGNTLLLFGFLGCMIVIATSRGLRRGSGPVWIAAAIAGFLVYSLALRWQPSGSRLHTPFFLVAAVPVAIVLGSRSSWNQSLAIALLLFASLPYLLLNKSRPLLPLFRPSVFATSRFDQYYVDRPWFETPSRQAGSFVRESGEPEVGLLLGHSDYEYPLWLSFKKDFAEPPTVRHVGVADAPPALLESNPPPPETVVTSRIGERHVVDGFEYLRIRDFGALSVLRRREPGD